MKTEQFKNVKKQINIIIVLLFVGMLSVKYFRPYFTTVPILSDVLACLPNCLGLIFVGLLFMPRSLNRGSAKKCSLYFYTITIMFTAYTCYEEYYPFLLGSKVSDIKDVYATIVGLVCVSLIFEVYLKKLKKQNHYIRN